jgi:hypothetical protein
MLCRNSLLKHVTAGKYRDGYKGQDGEEDVGSYWMTFKKIEDTVN